MNKVLLTTATLLFAITVMAQKADLSGTWKLKGKKGISGCVGRADVQTSIFGILFNFSNKLAFYASMPGRTQSPNRQ